MRIDKFLQVTRLIKRRSLAQIACQSGRVLVNGKPVKPSSSVKVGDRIVLLSQAWEMEVQVSALPGEEKREFFTVIRRERRVE